MKWFKHDSGSRHDAKIQKLRLKYGLEGYGMYFFLLECVAGTIDKHNLTFELEEDAELIAAATNIHVERVEEMMRYMVNLGLFEEDAGRITCLKMALRTDEYTQKLLKSSEKLPTVSRQTPDSVGTKSVLIEENRTEEKRKLRRFTPPSVNEVSEYAKEKGLAVNATKFVNYYESNGWMVGRNKMKSWKHAVANWASNGFNDKNKNEVTEVWKNAI